MERQIDIPQGRKTAILTLQEMHEGHYQSGKIKDRFELYEIQRKLMVNSGIVKFFFQIYLVLKVDLDQALDQALEKVRLEMESTVAGYDSQTPSVDHKYYRDYRKELENTVRNYFSYRNQFTSPQLESIMETKLVNWVSCETELQKLMYRKVSRVYTKTRFEDTFVFLNELECDRLSFDNVSFQSLAKKSGLVVAHESPYEKASVANIDTSVTFDEFNGFDFDFDSLTEYDAWEKVDFLFYKKKYDSDSDSREQNKLFVKDKGEQVITRFALSEITSTDEYEKRRRDALGGIGHG